MKVKPLVAAGVIALFLYWVVQDPVGVAAALKAVFDWILEFLQLLASRIVQFLSALV